MKLTNGLLAFGALLVSSQVNAAPITFNLEYSGVEFGNNAVARGRITFEDTLLPNPGTFLTSLPSPIVLGISLTVTGATTGNGTFGLSNFSQIEWDTEGATLDFSQELVGQDTDGLPWGVDAEFGTSGGEFHLHGVSGAPVVFGPFLLRTGGGTGDRIALTSMRVVPVPATVWLFGSGLLGLIGVARSKRQS